MGRKSRKRLQLKPFCYFCNREFDDEKVLIQHQKAKHFKCGECNRKLETANGLAVHMQQVHKLIQRKVPHAMEGRDNINSVVQGMHGIPFEIVEEHQMKHHKKIGDIDSRKQQRISWAIVSTAPTAEQFLAQLAVGNVYFPGFTAMPENYVPPQAYPAARPPYAHAPMQMPPYGADMGHMYGAGGQQQPGHGRRHGPPGGGSYGHGGSDKRGRGFSNGHVGSGFQAHDDKGRGRGFGPSGSGPLILGPKGTPIEPAPGSNFGAAVPVGRPTGSPSAGAGNAGFSTPRGFSDAPGAAPKPAGFSSAPGFSKPAGFSDAGTGFSKPAGFSDAPSAGKPAGFSDAPGAGRPAPGFSNGPAGFSDTPPTSSPTQDKVQRTESAFDKSAKPAGGADADKGRIIQTQFFKTTGVAPLFTPPPALGTTKLAYDVDAESIEETRAKVLYKWEEKSG